MLEASLILPIFIVFVVGLIICIQIAIIELALQATVSEATRSIAGQLYPARLLSQDVKLKFEQSAVGEKIQSAVQLVQTSRDKVLSAEQLADEYAAYIPDALLELIKREQEQRIAVEEKAQNQLSEIYEEHVAQQIYAALTPIVYGFGESKKIKKDDFKVISLIMPDLLGNGEAYFGIEAQVTYKLPLPFVSQTIILKKRAFERAWIGM